MTLFYTRRPRRFNHRLIYSDERQTRLKKMEEQAKRDIHEPHAHEHLRGAFSKSVKHLHDKKEKAGNAVPAMRPFTGITVIAALLLIVYWLLTGRLI